MTLYKLAEDIRNIMRGGIASKDDTISIPQVAYWIRTIYAQKAQEAITSTPPTYPVNDMWVKRYTCIPLSYPADAPCNCEKEGFWVGKLELPNLFTREGRQAIERVQPSGYEKSLLRATVDTVKGLVTGTGLQARLRGKLVASSFYAVNQKLYVVGNPALLKRPTDITLHLAQTNPMLDLAAGETKWDDVTMWNREVSYPDQFLTLIRREALSVEARAMVAGLNAKDDVNDAASRP